MSNLEALPSVALETVTGGTNAVKTASTDAALTSQLSGLSSSIADLKAKPAQSGGALFGNPTNMMMFAMLAMNRPQPVQPNVVVVGRRW